MPLLEISSSRPILLAASAACLAVVAVAVGCAGSRAASEPEPDPARPLEVRRGDFQRRMLLTGELAAEDAVVLIAPNVGVWPLRVRWLAEDGAEVEHGDVVIEFDNSQLVVEMENAEAALLQAEDELTGIEARVAADQAQAAFEVEQRRAEVDKARLEAAIPAELQASREHDRKQLELRRAELALTAAEHKLATTREAGGAEIAMKKVAIEQARSKLDRALDGIEKLTLRAPRSGIVLVGDNWYEGRPIQSGDSVYPGSSAVQLPNLATLYVRAQLFDVDDGRVRPGQPIRATLDAFPERSLSGHVRAVDPMAEEASRRSRRRVFGVTVDLDDVDPVRMRPGMSVKVVVEDPPRENVVLIPRASLDWSEDPPRARLADGSLVPVTVGACNPADCVVEAGPTPGTALGPAAEAAR